MHLAERHIRHGSIGQNVRMGNEFEEPRRQSDRSTALVILVHGTFAGDKTKSDVGERWWQRGSNTWKWLEENLPPEIRLPESHIRLFHWSGKNSQAERLAASLELLVMLIGLEKEGRKYHLVGHSHGGSLIWEALVSAQVILNEPKADVVPAALWDRLDRAGIVNPDWKIRVQNAPHHPSTWEQGPSGRDHVKRLANLNGLASWTTVGSPFLRFLPNDRIFAHGWPNGKFSLAAKKPATRRWSLFKGVTTTSFIAFMSFIFLADSVLLATLHSLFDVETRGISTSALVAAGALSCVVWVITALIDSQRDLASTVILRENAGLDCFARFHDRWLGVWAHTDEALRMLESTIAGPDYSYEWLCQPHENRESSTPPVRAPLFRVPQMNLRASRDLIGFVTRPRNGLRLISVPVKSIGYFAFNRFLSVRVSDKVNRYLLSVAQGSDVAGTTLAYASPWPVPIKNPPPGLPDRLSVQLENKANSALGRAGSAAREVLTQSALGGNNGETVSDRDGVKSQPLVHTSYFDDMEIMSIIGWHIRMTTDGLHNDKHCVASEEAYAWVMEAKRVATQRASELFSKIPREVP